MTKAGKQYFPIIVFIFCKLVEHSTFLWQEVWNYETGKWGPLLLSVCEIANELHSSFVLAFAILTVLVFMIRTRIWIVVLGRDICSDPSTLIRELGMFCVTARIWIVDPNNIIFDFRHYCSRRPPFLHA
jgi:hypothetical protein